MLLVEDNPVDALAFQRELAGRFEVRVAGTLSDALTLLAQASWRPDVVLSDLKLPDSEGLATLHTLQQAAPGLPVLVSTGTLTDTLRRQLDVLCAGPRPAFGAPPQPHAFQQHGPPLPLAAYRIEMIAEIDRISRQAADAAVSRAIDQLLDRLGLEDEEGLRMAIRLARGWEAAKIRFVSAMTTGFASALLLAIGAGLVAMPRHGTSK
jgi:DNA-binding NarL/FixJ family response regulator